MHLKRALPEKTPRNRNTGTGNGSGRNTGKRSIKIETAWETGLDNSRCHAGEPFVLALSSAGIRGFPALMCCYRLAVQNERREADIHGKLGDQTNGKTE